MGNYTGKPFFALTLKVIAIKLNYNSLKKQCSGISKLKQRQQNNNSKWKIHLNINFDL